VRLKSYFASSVQAAMQEARTEMGVDAILVTTRTAAPEARHLGEYEVVFAADFPESAAAPSASAAKTARPAPTEQSAALNEISAKLKELRSHFASWQRTRVHDAGQPSWMVGNEALEEAFATLIDADVDRECALELMAKTHMRLRSSAPAGPEPRRRFGAEARAEARSFDAARLRAVLSDEIQTLCSTDATLDSGDDEGPKIVALVGPPGAGKTTTIAKLAVQYALPARKRSALISMDHLRVGASEHLRAYASVLGIGMTVVETNRALAQAIEEHRNKEFIFIDTAGLGFRDLDSGRELADFLARRSDVQTHLVMPASLRYSDMTRVSTAFDMFRPSRLIFTRIDETAVLGPILSETGRSGKPISFVTDGQRVPEDIRPANVPELVDAMFSAADIGLSHHLSAA
jgi:flagellar biosynthesis protein FlhF